MLQVSINGNDGWGSPSPCIPGRRQGRGEEGSAHIWNLLCFRKTNDWSIGADAVPTTGHSQAWVLQRWAAPSVDGAVSLSRRTKLIEVGPLVPAHKTRNWQSQDLKHGVSVK